MIICGFLKIELMGIFRLLYNLSVPQEIHLIAYLKIHLLIVPVYMSLVAESSAVCDKIINIKSFHY